MARTPADTSIVVTGIAEDLPVAASATTSRTLVDNDEVRVVAFTFDTDEQLTEHTAALPVIVQLISGVMDFEVAGETHRLAPGDTVYLAAREPHSLVARAPSMLSLVMLRGSGDGAPENG